MKILKVLDINRIALISPELALMLLVYYFQQTNPEWFSRVSISLKSSSGLPEFVGALPFVFVVASYKLGNYILRPSDEEENKILYEWPLYWALEYRVYAAMIICVAGCLAAIYFYVNPSNLSESASGALIVGGTGIPFITIVTLVLAKLTIRKILTMYR